MRFLKITIIAIFIAFSAACYFLSEKKTSLQTHHSQTVREANPQNIKGDFERENRFELNGVKAEMTKNGDEFFIRFDDREYKIKAVVGDEKLEEYIAESSGKTIRLPIAYDLKQNRWIHLNDTFFETDGVDFFAAQKDWETNCASCHLETSAQNFPTDCAACHSKNLHESEAEIVRFSAREHQGISRSVCFVKNKGGNVINCQSCHSADVREKPSEQSCLNCHQQFSAPQAAFEHSKHQPNSANCFSCHQPEIAYGHLEFQRTHEISVPNAELTATKNIPNACNLCHTDKSVNWAILHSKTIWAEHFRDTKLSDDTPFNEAESIRSLFAGDAYTRALAADALHKHSVPNWFEPFALEAFADEDYPLVRYFLANYLGNKTERIETLENRKRIKKTVQQLRLKRKNPDIQITE